VCESLDRLQREHERHRGEPADAGNTFEPLQFQMLRGQLGDPLIVAGDR
jgi:hypothetical protein